MAERNLEKKVLQSIILKAKVGSQRQDLEQWSWRPPAYWIVRHGLLSLLSYIMQDHLPSGGTAHLELGPPTSMNMKVPQRHAYSTANLMEAVLQMRFSLPMEIYRCVLR